MSKDLKVCIIRHSSYFLCPRVQKETEALIEKGYEVDVICLKGPSDKLNQKFINNINIYRLPLYHRRKGIIQYIGEYLFSFIFTFIKLNYLYLKRRYKVIQVNTMPDFLVFVTIIPKLFGARIILDMHEAMPELFMSKFGFNSSHLFIKLLKLSEYLSMRYADYVLVVSDQILQLYRSRGFNSSMVAVIYNVPDERLFDYRKYNLIKNKNTKFIVFSHGSILKIYGFQTLIKAVPYLKDVIPEIRVVILGNGEYSNLLVNLVKQNNLENYITLKGYVPLEDVPALISTADVTVVPIIKNEFTDLMLPTKLFEYVAMRKPVISTNLRTIKSYFDDSCLKFFESGNEKALARCIIEIYKDSKKRDMLRENAWEKYKKMRWSETRNKYYKVFMSILNNQSKY